MKVCGHATRATPCHRGGKPAAEQPKHEKSLYPKKLSMPARTSMYSLSSNFQSVSCVYLYICARIYTTIPRLSIIAHFTGRSCMILSYSARCVVVLSMSLPCLQTIQLFPALAKNPAKLRTILDTGMCGIWHACMIGALCACTRAGGGFILSGLLSISMYLSTYIFAIISTPISGTDHDLPLSLKIMRFCIEY